MNIESLVERIDARKKANAKDTTRTVRAHFLQTAREIAKHNSLNGYAIVAWDEVASPITAWRTTSEGGVFQNILPAYCMNALNNRLNEK